MVVSNPIPNAVWNNPSRAAVRCRTSRTYSGSSTKKAPHEAKATAARAKVRRMTGVERANPSPALKSSHNDILLTGEAKAGAGAATPIERRRRR